MSLNTGDLLFWRLLTQLAGDGSLAVAANTTTDTLLETVDAATGDRGHVFYLLSLFTKDSTLAFPLSEGMEAPGRWGLHVYGSVYRKYVSGAPASWEAYLRLTNLSAASVTVYYKVYRLAGLI